MGLSAEQLRTSLDALVALEPAFAGALIHGLYLGGVFFAVRHGLPAGIVALVAGLQPLLTALLAGGMLGERVSPRQWFGLVLGLVGVTLVLEPRLVGANTFQTVPLLAAFGAMVAISVGTVWQKRFVGTVDLVTGTAIQYAGALVPASALESLVLPARVRDYSPALLDAPR